MAKLASSPRAIGVNNSPGALSLDKAALHIGAVTLAKPQVRIHRFGSSLNAHVHFHVCAVDGVFEEVPVAVEGEADAQSSPPCIVFHPARAIDETAVARMQATLQKRILRAFVSRGLLECCDAKDMLTYQRSEPGSDKRGAKVDELHLTLLELIDRIETEDRAKR